MTHLPLSGRCLCGAVTVTCSAQPLMTVACHCRDCQKISAGAFTLTAMFAADTIEIAGDTVLGGLRHPDRAHHFCAICLTCVYSKLAWAPERVNLRLSVLDHASAYPPFMEVMTDEGIAAPLDVPHSFATVPESAAVLGALMTAYAERSRRM